MSRPATPALSYRGQVAERRIVKVMWDYDAFPLWVTAGRLGQVSSQIVPASADLSRRLQVWSDELITPIWGPNRPDARGWNGPDPHHLATANEKGQKLADLVRGELDDEWDGTYFDEELGGVVEIAPTHESIRRRHNDPDGVLVR